MLSHPPSANQLQATIARESWRHASRHVSSGTDHATPHLQTNCKQLSHVSLGGTRHFMDHLAQTMPPRICKPTASN
eukprot:7555205-Heterocapsa_arctica.AAC.1